MVGTLLRAALLALLLAGPAGVAAADQSATAAVGREIQTLAAYNATLVQIYLKAANIYVDAEDLEYLVEDYESGELDDDSLRRQMREELSKYEAGIRQLEADLAALPEVPAATQPSTQKMQRSIRAFKDFLLRVPEGLKKALQLHEQSAAAAIAGDDVRSLEVMKEQLTLYAGVIDGESALLRAQIELLDQKSFIIPLQECVIHHNDSLARLLRSWADAEEIDLSAAMAVMEDDLAKADRSRKTGERKLKATRTVYGIRNSLSSRPKGEAEAMTELLDNMSLAYDVERQLVEKTRAFGQALTDAGNTGEALPFDIYWLEISALIDRRIALGTDRLAIAQRIGASMQ
jgi:hypothetical protein